jgi:hypothetical protein
LETGVTELEGRAREKAESARRSLQAAFEHIDKGDFRTAGALLRACGRYVEGIGDADVISLRRVGM